jgi:hypothetical protein
MLPINLMEQRYSLSDPGMDDALIEMRKMSRFAGNDLLSKTRPRREHNPCVSAPAGGGKNSARRTLQRRMPSQGAGLAMNQSKIHNST